jgi:hypothetical protein
MNKSKPFYFFRNRWFTLFLEEPGVISSENAGPIWVLFYDCYMHCNHSLPKLLWEAAKEYKDDKHLVG